MRNSIPLILSVFLFLCSCGKSSLETTFASQSDKIDSYVTRQLESHPEYRVVYDEGVVRMIVADGEGAELAKGGRVTFYYVGYTFNNTTISVNNMFATNDPDVAASSNWDLSDSTLFVPTTITLGKDKLVSGLEIGLRGVQAGEDSFIFFSGKYGFGKQQLGTIPANAAICYHVRIEEIEN